MYKGKTVFVVQTIVIAVAYIILTLIANMFGMAKGIIQVRISDALTILPYFTPAAIPGLFIGCLISNGIVIGQPAFQELFATGTITSAYMPYMYDVILGSCATLLAAIISYMIRKYKFLVCIPPIAIVSVVVPLLFKFVYRYEDSLSKCFLSVGVGELISCGLLGTALLMALEDSEDTLFPNLKGALPQAEGDNQVDENKEPDNKPVKSTMELKEEALAKERELLQGGQK